MVNYCNRSTSDNDGKHPPKRSLSQAPLRPSTCGSTHADVDECLPVWLAQQDGPVRTRLIALCTVAAVLCLDTLAWRIAVAQLEGAADRWMAQARLGGWSVSDQGRVRGGWPWAATLAFSDVQTEGGDRLMPGGLSWSANRLVLSLALLQPATLGISVFGQQHLRLSHAPWLVFTADRAQAAIKLWGSRVPLAELQADGLEGGLAGSRHPKDVQVAGLSVRLDALAGAKAAWPPARLDLRAVGIGLPDTGQWALGARVAELSGSVLLTTPGAANPPATPAAPGTPEAERQARAWRDGGGRLAVQDLRLRWGPTQATASAVLGLDGRLQPAGTGQVDLAGSQATLSALASAGVIPSGLAATAGAVLAFMPRVPADPEAVRLPVVLRDNTVSVGQIPIVRFGDVAWSRQ